MTQERLDVSIDVNYIGGANFDEYTKDIQDANEALKELQIQQRELRDEIRETRGIRGIDPEYTKGLYRQRDALRDQVQEWKDLRSKATAAIRQITTDSNAKYKTLIAYQKKYTSDVARDWKVQAKAEDAVRREQLLKLKLDIVRRNNLLIEQQRKEAVLSQIQSELGRGNAAQIKARETEERKRQAEILRDSNKRIALAAREAKEEEKRNASTSRWLFTLRRVVLVYGAIRAAQATVAAVAQGIAQSITFGNELESTQKAIAGLVATTFDVRDATGELLKPVQAYEAALGQAREQVKQLQRDALGSAATFRELNENFQLAVAPGAAAGFSLDVIREFTLSISQLATALGIEQNQLAEEIRSLFSGNINLRNSRIAAILQITPEDIRRTREAGEQVEFLREKFEGIKASTKDLQNSLPVVFSDLKDAAQFAGEQGLNPLRESLRKVALELRDLAISEGTSSLINPQIVQALRPIGDALARVVENVSGAREGIGAFLLEFSTLSAQSLSTLSEFADASGGLLLVVSQALRAVTASLRVLSSVIDSLSGEGFGKFVGVLLTVTLSLKTLSKLFTVLEKTILRVPFAVGRFQDSFSLAAKGGLAATTAAMLGLNTTLLVTLGRLAAIAGVVYGAGAAFDKLGAKFPGIKKALADISADLQLNLFNIFGLGADGSAAEDVRKQLADGSIFQSDAPFQATMDEMLGKVKTFTAEISGSLGALDKGLEEKGGQIRQKIEGLFTLDQAQADFRDSGILQTIREEFSSIIGASGLVEQALDIQLQLREKQKLLEQDIVREIERREAEIARADADTQEGAQLISAVKNEIYALTVNGLLTEREYTFELERQLKLLQLQTAEVTEQTKNQLNREFAVQSANAALDSSFVFRDQISQYFEVLSQVNETKGKIAKLDEQEITTRDRLLKIEQDIEAARKSKNNEEVRQGKQVTAFGSNVARDTAREQIGLLNQQRALEATKLELLQKQLEEIEKQNTARAGAEAALTSQVQSLTSAENTNRLVTDLSETFRSGLSSAAISAFDPRSNVPLSTALTNIGYDMAGSFIQFLLDQAVFQPLFNSLAGAFGLNTESPAAIAQVAAATQLTLAGTGLTFAAIRLTVAAALLSGAAAAQAGSAVASGLGAAAAGGAVAGGPLGIFAAGLTSIFGAAEGGTVPGSSALPFPVPGFDSRDRVPALLRAGEFVATPEMEREAPGLYGTLEALRRRAHGLGSAGKLPSAIASRASLSGVQGFAAGGAVQGASFGGGGGVMVLPVLVKDRQELDQIVTSPSFARAAQIHRTSIRAASNPRPE